MTRSGHYPGRAVLWAIAAIAAIGAAVAGFSALFHRPGPAKTASTTAPSTQPAPPPPPKPIPLGKLDPYARFIPPDPRLLVYVDAQQIQAHRLVRHFQDRFAPYLAEFHLLPNDIRRIVLCGENSGGFAAVRLSRHVPLDQIFTNPSDPIRQVDGAPQTRARTSFGTLLATMPEPDLLILILDDAKRSPSATIAELLARRNRSGEFGEHLVDAIRTLDAQQAFVIYSRKPSDRDAQTRPALEAAGVTLSNVLGAKSLLAYHDERAAGAAMQALRSLKADLKSQHDPLASLVDDIVWMQSAQTIRLSGQWGITSILRLLISSPDPRDLAPSAQRIADRLHLLP